MSKSIAHEITLAEMGLAEAQSRALRCLESYEARPLGSTRKALHAHRELMLLLGCDDVANQIIETLWFRGNDDVDDEAPLFV